MSAFETLLCACFNANYPLAHSADNFKLPLPPDLPPSYLGKSISFTYTLSIGTNRLDISAPTRAQSGTSKKASQKSRLIQIPIRIYNHVSMTGVRPFWDLLNPVIWVRDGAAVTAAELDMDDESLEGPPATPIAAPTATAAELIKKAKDESSHTNLVTYAKELLASCSSPLPKSGSQGSSLADGSAIVDHGDPSFNSSNAFDTSYNLQVSTQTPRKGLMRRRSSTMSAASRGQEEDTIDTCMEAVEVLSRISSKGKYSSTPQIVLAPRLTNCFFQSRMTSRKTVKSRQCLPWSNPSSVWETRSRVSSRSIKRPPMHALSA